jgi:PAS domain S-box-containing protein/putative nucleotidyltransferase with HDIG domain
MGKPLRALIVEDSENDALLLLRELQRGGYAVEFERVETAGAMLSALAQKTWDVILSDYSLPAFNALEALDVLKASDLDLPFIIISGTIGEETAVAALKGGAHDFLAKGNFARLGPAIERELREAESRLERRRAEDQLKYQARLLRNINDAVIATDDQFRITAWNRAAEKMYGWPSEEVMGRNVSEILSDELTDDQRAETRQLLRESMVSRSERIYHRKNGRTIYVETNTIALTDPHGKMTGYASVDRDITERKQAEEAVRESERQYRSLFEDSPISLWVEDLSELKRRLDQLKASGIEDIPAYLHEHPDFVMECANQVRVLDVNSTSVKLYHARSKAELLGTLTSVLPAIPVEQFERELIKIARGQLNFELEGEDKTLTGEKIHVSLRWTVAPGYEDTLARVIVSTIDVTERKRAEEQTQLQIQRLKALRAIDVAISSSFNLNLTLDILLDQVISQLKADAAAILLFDPNTRGLEHAASRGFRTSAIRTAKVRLGEGYAGKAVLERRTIHVSNIMESDGELPPAFLQMLAEEAFIDYYCVPLLVKGEVKGALEIFHRSRLESDPEWLDFLETLAGQAAIAIEDSTLFENLQRSNQELFQAYDATIEGWSHALDLRDKETEGHTQRVTELTLALARKFGFTDEQLINIRWGALLHDIGKMGVPDSILLKPGKLTDEEWQIMKQHPTFALEMLSPIRYLTTSLDIPYCHHEKWDGTGYPRGLKGEMIPLAARLFAVVDVWDALRSDRPYRKAWTIEQTSEYIRSQAGTYFDPKAVELFLELVQQRGEN